MYIGKETHHISHLIVFAQIFELSKHCSVSVDIRHQKVEPVAKKLEKKSSRTHFQFSLNSFKCGTNI